MKRIIAFILLIAAAAAILPGCIFIAKPSGRTEVKEEAVKPESDDPAKPDETPGEQGEKPTEIIREEIVLTSENFDEYINGDIPILVDFWADWCGPCMKLAPTVEEIAAESDGSYLVGKVNIDEQPELAARFEVYAIPTVIVFQNGREINRSVGLVSKEALLDLLK